MARGERGHAPVLKETREKGGTQREYYFASSSQKLKTNIEI